MGVWSYDFVEAQTHDGPQAQTHDVDRRVYSLSPFAMGTFYGNRTTRGGAAHRVLIKPSLDDPCTALCVIDRAPKPRAALRERCNSPRSCNQYWKAYASMSWRRPASTRRASIAASPSR